MEDGRGGRVDIAMEEIGGSGVDLGAWGRWCKEI
jgi:origin recognition complex subunit 4